MLNNISIRDFLDDPPEDDTFLLVDLRSKEMFSFGSLPDAVNLPLHIEYDISMFFEEPEIPKEDIDLLLKLPKDKTIYLLCQAGVLSAQAAQILSDAGYDAFNLEGGYRAYLSGGL